ncbi:MAG: hypothetical protein HFF64_04660 [Oscillospiraceae bacterium]|nr:hypothetical protein [Oscillospiraceae bacterium]
MDIRKTPGSVTRHSVNREDMALINRLAKTELTPEQVYTFAVRLCDNEVDRDWERFDEAGLEALSALFVGKSGIFDHHWSAQEQTARLYRTEVCRESGTTAAGDGIRYLKGYAYMLRSEKNRDLIEEIEAGIKKEVSVGCSVAGRVCSVCGADHCGHQGGSRYGGKLCYFTLTGPTDAYEWSFVAVPAQRRAGVIKSFARAPALKRLVQEHPECRAQLEALEEEARMGRSYMRGLRRELVRLAGLTDEALDLKLLAKTAEKLDEEELLALSGAYRRRMDEKYPPSPQLRPRPQPVQDEEDGAFLV